MILINDRVRHRVSGREGVVAHPGYHGGQGLWVKYADAEADGAWATEDELEVVQPTLVPLIQFLDTVAYDKTPAIAARNLERTFLEVARVVVPRDDPRYGELTASAAAYDGDHPGLAELAAACHYATALPATLAAAAAALRGYLDGLPQPAEEVADDGAVS